MSLQLPQVFKRPIAGRESVLAEIFRTPDADSPRERFADLLRRAGANDLAELIRIQLRRFRDDVRLQVYRSSPSESERALLKAINGEVADLADSRDPAFEYNRGFVEYARLGANDFVLHSDRLFASTPLLHLELLPEDVRLEQLLEVRGLARLETLALPGWSLTDDHARLLASSDAIRNLLALELPGNKLTRAGVEALGVRSRPELLVFDLTDNPFDPRDVPDLDEDGRSIYHLEPEGRLLEQQARRSLAWLHPERARHADRYHRRLIAADAHGAASMPAPRARAEEAAEARPGSRT